MEEKVLILGNKPYRYLEISKVLDCFDKNVRCNLGIPCFNNGSIKDELVTCGHIYEFLIQKNKMPEACAQSYKDDYDKEHLEFFLETMNTEDYNAVKRLEPNTGAYNRFLIERKCPYYFSKLPRTGYAALFEKILENKYPVVSNFSINNETRASFYVNEEVYKREDPSQDVPHKCHEKKDEINIVRWLHENNHVDATLCMLKDEPIPTLEGGGLRPSEYIIELLNKTYGEVVII